MVLSLACSHRRFFGEIVYKKEYQFGLNVFSDKYFDQIFGVHLINYDSSNYIVFLDSNFRLNFKEVNTNRLKDFSIDCEKYFSIPKYFSVRFSGASMYLLDSSDSTLYQYKFNRDSIYIETSYDLKRFVDLKNFYVKFQLYNSFEIFYPTVYLSYGNYDSKSSFLDNASYIKMNLLDSLSIRSSICNALLYPVVFRKKKYRNSNTFLVKADSSTFFYGFASLDSIYLYDFLNDSILKRSEFNQSSSYRKYNKKKATDFSYLRWYDETGEINFKMLADRKGNCLILKRQQKERLTDIDVYEYFFLNNDLKVLYHNIFPYNLNPHYCFNYENGFLIFNQELTKAFYYEF